MSSSKRNSLADPQARTDSPSRGVQQAQQSHNSYDRSSSLPPRRPSQQQHEQPRLSSPPRRPKRKTWPQRTSQVQWGHKWSLDEFQDGRVLIVDYLKQEHVESGRTQIAYQEFSNVEGLGQFYKKSSRCRQAALRIIHVQNAPWAIQFFLAKFGIDSSDELVGTDFGKWAKFDKPQVRGKKPVLRGRTFRNQADPWRGIRRTALGLDYLKHYDAQAQERAIVATDEASAQRKLANASDDAYKMMELNKFDNDNGETYGYDVFVQRVSVYLQIRDEDAPPPPDDVDNPYPPVPKAYTENGEIDPKELKEKMDANGTADTSGTAAFHKWKKKRLPVEYMDNSSTVLIIENSKTRSPKDTLIQARSQIESRWRRLTFYLPQGEISDDEKLAAACMNQILTDLFKAIAINWDEFLNVTETHVSILEDKIYDSPADETRAPELWNNSATWLKVEKLINIHVDVVKEAISRLRELDDEETPQRWLENLPEEFEKIGNMIQEDLVKPTANLNDLMYKSVEVRDSRHSLQLNTSMWRLSWITFIFLPLTFTVGVFGMNVDTFSSDPSLKWFFIVSVPLMVLVLLLWYFLKHMLARHHQTPYQKGVYEHFFHDLAVSHPDLWTRHGPRTSVQPRGFYSKVRWFLLTRWFDPKKTINKPSSDPDEDAGGSGMGSWARCKRALARQWLGTISQDPGSGEVSTDPERGDSIVMALMSPAADAMAIAEPAIRPLSGLDISRLDPLGAFRRTSSPVGRPSSSGSSNGMVYEEGQPTVEGIDDGTWRGIANMRPSIDSIFEHRFRKA